MDRAYIHQNHLAGLSNHYSSDRSDLIWTPDEIALFLDGDAERRVDPAPTHLRRLFTTALETGLRPGDIRILSRAHIQATEKGRRIYIRTAKRKRFVSIPVTEAMGRVIDTTPTGQVQIIVGERGQPYAQTPSLGQAVSRRRDECGIRKELQLRDTRGTAATRLFEADATLREIAAHMGWSVAHTAKMIETYVRMNPDASDRLLIRLQSTGV